jgi:Flp pilus assembly protein TadG
MALKMGDKTGVSAVEFAIILPLLLVIIFGIIEFGLVLFNKQVITNASREGARAGIVARNPRINPNDIEGIVKAYTGTYLITFGSDKTTYVTSVVSDPLGNVKTTDEAVFEDTLEVTVDFNYEFLIFDAILSLVSGGEGNGWGTLPLSARTLMRYE